MGAGSGICIGVVENFHFNSLKQHVEPMALCMREGFHQYLVVKMGDGNVNSTIRFIETEWKKFTQNQPFNYYFLSHDFDNLYKNERKISQIILITERTKFNFTASGIFSKNTDTSQLCFFTTVQQPFYFIYIIPNQLPCAEI